MNPSHTYANTGVYVATLTIIGANSSTCSYTDTFTVNTCTANFTYNVTSSGTVSFTNQSNPLNAALVNISWSFGDGNFSNIISPTHTYALSGSYNIKLFWFAKQLLCNLLWYGFCSNWNTKPMYCFIHKSKRFFCNLWCCALKYVQQFWVSFLHLGFWWRYYRFRKNSYSPIPNLWFLCCLFNNYGLYFELYFDILRYGWDGLSR